MLKGDVVLIKASRNQPGVRRIWDPTPERPFVCLEDYWLRWERYQLDPICWQIPRSQIFQFDAALAASLEAAFSTIRNDPQAAAKLEKLWASAKPAARD